MRSRKIIAFVLGAVVMVLVAYKLLIPTRNSQGHILVDTGSDDVSWSSDSSALYFLSESSGIQKLVRYDIRTRRRSEITIGEKRGFVGFSPDEKFMLLLSYKDDKPTAIWKREITTGIEKSIYTFHGNLEGICWPKAGLIVFKENDAIYTMDEQGQHLTKIVGRVSEFHGSADS